MFAARNDIWSDQRGKESDRSTRNWLKFWQGAAPCAMLFPNIWVLQYRASGEGERCWLSAPIRLSEAWILSFGRNEHPDTCPRKTGIPGRLVQPMSGFWCHTGIRREVKKLDPFFSPFSYFPFGPLGAWSSTSCGTETVSRYHRSLHVQSWYTCFPPGGPSGEKKKKRKKKLAH